MRTGTTPRTEFAADPPFDPLREARVTVDSLGWTAEMRIPFSRLRFTDAAEWGVGG